MLSLQCGCIRVMPMPKNRKSYSEMLQFDNFGDRFNYLSLRESTYDVPDHGGFYKDPIWLAFRKEMFARDGWFDLGCPGMKIEGRLLLHHINPLVQLDFETFSPNLLDPENVITTSYRTHGRIHYLKAPPFVPAERHPGDTKLW